MPLPPLFQALAWALLHFLWQGLLLWALAALALRLGRTAQARYLIGLGFLAAALALPLLTWGGLLPRAVHPGPNPGDLGPAELVTTAALQHAPSLSFALNLPWILGAWGLGAGLMTLRLLGGWLWLQRLKARMEPLEAAWELRLRALARRMGLRRPFRVGLSTEVTTPLVIGWIRPVLLLPAGLLTGLDPLALEALLAHEVAHLRRHDVLLNWLQCAVEVLLFYHPAVWWLSKRIRLERECACDDAAVAFCGDPLRYAETLNRLDDLRSLEPHLAQAANGGNLMYRITRLLSPKAGAPRLPLALPLLLLTGGALALAARTPQAPAAAPQPKASASAPAPTSRPRPVAKATGSGSATSPSPSAQATPAPQAEGQATPMPAAEAVRGRSVQFMLWFIKDREPALKLEAERATRAEVEAALARIETLIKQNPERGKDRGPIRGEWKLKTYKGSEEDLLTFKLSEVTLAEARQLF